MKISKIKASNLRNDEHFQLHAEFNELLIEMGNIPGADPLKIQVQVEEYRAAYAKEDEALRKITKSVLTTDIKAADKVRDRTFRGIVDANKSALQHFNPTTEMAAKRLQVVLDTYGNVARKPINEETAAIHNLLQELKGAYATDAATVGITDWVAELEANNNAVADLVRDRYDEQAARTELVLKEVREQVDAAYRNITERIDAYVLIEDSALHKDFIRQWNIVVEKYSLIMAQRQGRKEQSPPAPSEDGENG
ncbi:MAG: DUF6261 family protein [Tannerella sp.]|jgi:hypothetical protein|nr:DUF6261 family protein [Tannerella sp.]